MQASQPVPANIRTSSTNDSSTNDKGGQLAAPVIATRVPAVSAGRAGAHHL
jgi:hypothetical protein